MVPDNDLPVEPEPFYFSCTVVFRQYAQFDGITTTGPVNMFCQGARIISTVAKCPVMLGDRIAFQRRFDGVEGRSSTGNAPVTGYRAYEFAESRVTGQ